MNEMNISFVQMWYFIQVVEYGNFARAAQYLNVTQSTIAKSVQSLENKLNVQLFFRKGKNLTLTNPGCLLYDKFVFMIKDMEETLDTIHHHKGGCLKTLHIGTLDSHRSEAYLLDYLDRYQIINSKCAIQISVRLRISIRIR